MRVILRASLLAVSITAWPAFAFDKLPPGLGIGGPLDSGLQDTGRTMDSARKMMAMTKDRIFPQGTAEVAPPSSFTPGELQGITERLTFYRYELSAIVKRDQARMSRAQSDYSRCPPPTTARLPTPECLEDVRIWRMMKEKLSEAEPLLQEDDTLLSAASLLRSR